MKAIKPFNISYWQIVVPIGIVFATISQLYSTVCGLGITFDSNMYLESAKYFQNSATTWAFNHLTFQYKPPLYPLFLAVFSNESIRVVNTILLSITLITIAFLFDTVLKSKLLKSLGFLSVATFTPIIMVHVYLWTEPLFLLILFGSALLYVKYSRSKNLKMLIGLGVLGILLTLIRHVGVFFVFGYFLAILLDNSNKNWKAFLYLLVGSFGFIIWNLLIKAGGFYDRIVTFGSPIRNNSFARLDNIYLFLRGASLWILPNNLPDWSRISILIVFICILAFALIGIFKRSSQPVLKGFVIIVITYYLLMHIVFKLYVFSEERYLVPIYPLFILVVFSTIEMFKKEFRVRFNTVILIISLWLLYPTVRTVKNTIFWQKKICNEKIIESTMGFSSPTVMVDDCLISL